MTEHDRIRKERAEDVESTFYPTTQHEIAALEDAIRGLQSTDDPSLNSLHDRLMARYKELKTKLNGNNVNIPAPPKPAQQIFVEMVRQMAEQRGYDIYITVFDQETQQSNFCIGTGPGSPFKQILEAHAELERELCAQNGGRWIKLD